jgi:hypothetical protein
MEINLVIIIGIAALAIGAVVMNVINQSLLKKKQNKF